MRSADAHLAPPTSLRRRSPASLAVSAALVLLSAALMIFGVRDVTNVVPADYAFLELWVPPVGVFTSVALLINRPPVRLSLLGGAAGFTLAAGFFFSQVALGFLVYPSYRRVDAMAWGIALLAGVALVLACWESGYRQERIARTAVVGMAVGAFVAVVSFYAFVVVRLAIQPFTF